MNVTHSIAFHRIARYLGRAVAVASLVLGSSLATFAGGLSALPDGDGTSGSNLTGTLIFSIAGTQPNIQVGSAISIAFGDGYPGSSDPANIHGGVPSVSFASFGGGLWAFNQSSGGYTSSYDATGAITFGKGNGVIFTANCSNGCSDGSTYFDSLSTTPPYTVGLTTIEVVQPDGAGGFRDLPGATIQMYEPLHDTFAVGGVASERPLPGGNNGATWLTFGANPAGSRKGYDLPDYPYPSGMVTYRYNVRVTAAGFQPYNSATDASMSRTGDAWPGQGAIVVLYPVSSGKQSTGGLSNDPSVTPPPVTDPCARTSIETSTVQVGGSGFSWSDGNFPSYAQPTFLHSNSWAMTVHVATAGTYALSGDLATNSNMGAIHLALGGQVGPSVSCTTPNPGGIKGASLGSFTLSSGDNLIQVVLENNSYMAMKTLYVGSVSDTCDVGKKGSGTPGSGGTGTGTGTDDPTLTGFFSSFWDKLKQFFEELFTPSPDDYKAVSDAWAKYQTWGPFGLFASIRSQWQMAFPSSPSQDPNYWVIQFGTWGATDERNLPHPAGYNPDLPQQPSSGPSLQGVTLFGSLPASFDMRPYASMIVLGRGIACCFFWVAWVFGLIRFIRPAPKV